MINYPDELPKFIEKVEKALRLLREKRIKDLLEIVVRPLRKPQMLSPKIRLLSSDYVTAHSPERRTPPNRHAKVRAAFDLSFKICSFDKRSDQR
ncbi:MAG: hypothetical protein QOH01_3144 [Verrucomicrobiota bacterium]